MMKHLQLLMLATMVAGATYGQVTPYQAKEIKPYTGRDLSTEQKKPATVQQKVTSPASLQFFIRKWKTGVTDAFYEVTTAGVRTLVVQANARTKPLYINSNGTYYWEAYGEQKSGQWVATGKTDYPIMLKNAIENKNWYVGQHNNGKNAIYIWDHNAISYTGVPL